jgi:carboxypeptidase Taq
MGIHESQSLSFEMQLGRNPAFLSLISPLISEHLGTQPAFAADNLALLYSRVHPGYIRVDADELCYPAHVILRYEIEKALIEGEIEAEDIPALWDEKMQAYLGWIPVAITGRAACRIFTGPMAVSVISPATRWVRCMRRSTLPSCAAACRTWISALPQEICPPCSTGWTEYLEPGQPLPTAELVSRACGEALNPDYFRAHLQARYLG